MKRKRPIKRFQMTHQTKIKKIFDLNSMETRRVIKQMEVYGLHTIGYGIDYNNTIGQHAEEQVLHPKQLPNLLKSINRKL